MDNSLFLLGEDKKVRLKIVNRSNNAFKIREPTYTLEKNKSIVETGDCTIEDDTILSVQLKPQEQGIYILYYTFIIAEETFREKVLVQVYD